MKYSSALLFVFGLVFASWAFAASAGETSFPDAKAKLNALYNDVLGNKIAGLEIIYAESGDPPITSPEWFEEDCYFRLFINTSMKGAYLHSLSETLKGTVIQPGKEFPQDLRWGVVFYNWKKERIAVIYVSSDGQSGAIDKIPVRFSDVPLMFGLTRRPPLVAWLTSNFSGVFK